MSPGSIQSAQISSTLVQRPEPKSKEEAGADKKSDPAAAQGAAEEFRKEQGISTIGEV